MTTPTPEPTPGMGPEMGPEEAERLRQRLTAPAAPAGVLDGARAAAMAAFDEVHADSGEAAVAVRDIRSAPVRRSPAWYERIPLGAAAAVIAVVALVGIATQVDFGSTDADTAASSDDSGGDFEDSGVALEADEDAATNGGAGGTAGSRGGGESAPLAGDTAVSAYEDLDSLVDDFGARYGGAQEPTAPPVASTTDGVSPDDGEAYARCDAVDAADVDPTSVVAIERALLGADSVPTSVVVYESTAGLRVSVIDDESCVVRDDRAL